MNTELNYTAHLNELVRQARAIKRRLSWLCFYSVLSVLLVLVVSF